MNGGRFQRKAISIDIYTTLAGPAAYMLRCTKRHIDPAMLALGHLNDKWQSFAIGV